MSKQRIEKNVQIITIDKTEAFKYKTTFFAGKDAKTGHKNASNTADKHPHTPVKVSHRPGSAPVLMKKEAALTGFAPVPGRSLFLSYN